MARKLVFKNSTDWPDWFLRRMLSWVCKEVDCEGGAGIIQSVNFRNRSRRSLSGHASYDGEIVVSVGPAKAFPAKSRTFRDGFTVGVLADRVEALIVVTAHEVAHVDFGRRGNKTRGRGGWGGSERATDGRAKSVLNAFREQREALLAEWSEAPKYARPKDKPQGSVVAKRAAHAEAMAEKWRRKLKSARTHLKKWEQKAAYYRRKYPDGQFPVDGERKPRAPSAPNPERLLRKKIGQYITLGLKELDIRKDVEFYEFDGELTRPHEDHEWQGDFTYLKDVRKRTKFGDVLEVQGLGRNDFFSQGEIHVPPTEAAIDWCLKNQHLYLPRDEQRIAALTSPKS